MESNLISILLLLMHNFIGLIWVNNLTTELVIRAIYIINTII